jgi:hypothetical protein
MTATPSGDSKSANVPDPIAEDSVRARLKIAENKLTCCRDNLADARRDVRGLRRQNRRERRRELRSKAARAAVTTFSVALAVTGTIAFLLAVVLMAMGNFGDAKDALGVAGVAWGGASAIRRPRK